MRLAVKVVPGAARNALRGWLGGALKVAVTAAPERGRANDAVIELLAEALGVPRASIRITAGHTGPRKQVEIGGVSDPVLRERLERALAGPRAAAVPTAAPVVKKPPAD